MYVYMILTLFLQKEGFTPNQQRIYFAGGNNGNLYGADILQWL